MTIKGNSAWAIYGRVFFQGSSNKSTGRFIIFYYQQSDYLQKLKLSFAETRPNC